MESIVATDWNQRLIGTKSRDVNSKALRIIPAFA
jgi:hypothetical protein